MIKMNVSIVFIVLVLLLGGNVFAESDNFFDNNSIEIKAGVGVAGFMPLNLSTSKVSTSYPFPVYGSINVRYCYNDIFCPEVKVEDSGTFSFNLNNITHSSSTSGYGKYYIKIPTTIAVPFFTYPAHIFVDASYESIFQKFKLKQQAYIDGANYASGEQFSSSYSFLTARVYLDTPVVTSPNIFEYSYFGIFFSEMRMPSTVSTGSAPYSESLIVNTNTYFGGIFYDLKKDMFVKGLSFGINASVGYGDVKIEDDFGTMGASFGNLYGLFVFKVNAEIGYRYVFKNNLGIYSAIGIDYFGATEFLNGADKSKYNTNLGGGLKYYLNVGLFFGR